ncbi:MAG TPA: hypothetical protein VFG76_07480 [Candidatus Polarisedimenticolia bacterium]|nr:hypothetical protein [Candidatus Polarisedimenticolia bacterium]
MSLRLAIDIDDTLTPTNLHLASLLYGEHGAPSGMTPESIVAEYRHVGLVPFWPAGDYVDSFLADDDALSHLSPMPDAQAAMRRLAHRVICYITGRPRSVARTTSRWLEAHGFPRRHVICCPDPRATNPLRWKVSTLQRLYPHVTAIVDDHLDLPDKLGSDYPGVVFGLGHDRSGYPCAVACPSWADVVREVLARA